MAADQPPTTLRLTAGDITLAALAWGPPDGPLALCLHGYPDTAATWRHLGPYLAERGWRVVAPYTRGYGPSELAPDGAYQVGALARDAINLQRTLRNDEPVVLIGHDWGAVTAYVAGAHSPAAFRRIVTLAWPPAATLLSLRSAPLLALRQARLSWYMLFQQLPIVSERVLPALIPRLWAAWSPGYDASEDLEHVGQSLHSRERRVAALGYYRALLQPWKRSREYAPEQRHLYRLPPVPLLYLHGETDGCARADVAGRTEALLPAGSRFELIPDAGHFLHLERPDYVNPRIAEFIERRS